MAGDGARAGRGQRIPATPLATAAVALGALLVYRSTLLPGVYAWDTAEAQTVLPLLGTMHPTGFPAYVVIGWVGSLLLAPLGEPAFRVNLLSAILVAGAVAMTVPLLRRLAVPLVVSVAAAIGLALTPITWTIASAADAHALHLLLVAVLVLALLRWDRLVIARLGAPGDAVAARRADRAILLAAAVFGIALANHGLTLLLVPAVGLYVLAVDPGVLRRPRLVVAALGTGAAVAGVLYLQLPLRAAVFPAPLVYGNPGTWGGFWEVVLARQFQGDFAGLVGDPLRALGDLGRLAVAQLGPLSGAVLPAFMVTALRRPRYALLSGVATLLTCLFAAAYLNARIDRYYLGPALFAWSWLAVAAGTIVELVLDQARRADPGAPVDVLDHAVAPSRIPARTAVALALAVALLVPTGLGLGPRWRAVDRSGDTAMAAWLDDAMTRLPRDAVVVSWWSYSTTLWYGTLVEGRRPDLLVVDDSAIVYGRLGSVEAVIDRNLGRRPVYVIRATTADVASLALRYALEPVGRPAGMYRVTGPTETEP